MPSKRKARRDSPSSSMGEPETFSLRTADPPSIYDKVFSEISEKVEKPIGEKIKEPKNNQREINKMIENLTSNIDS